MKFEVTEDVVPSLLEAGYHARPRCIKQLHADFDEKGLPVESTDEVKSCLGAGKIESDNRAGDVHMNSLSGGRINETA